MNIRLYKHHTPSIGDNTFIDPSAVIIGDTIIGHHCSIWPTVVIRGDVNSIRIGDYTNIQDGSILHVTHAGEYGPGSALAIGNYVTIGHRVILHACSVHDDVLIGMGSIVLDRAIIEPYVMIGAGSLVPEKKTLESGYLYFGSPVKKIRPLTEQEKAFLRYSAENYALLKNTHIN